MTDAILAAERVSKRFGGILALSEVSFEVQAGEIFGIIGPNGAGKTTLFGCLVGALKPTSGAIRFLGERIDRLAPYEVVARGVVRTHQIVRPFREMTVRENVAVGAAFGAGRRRGPEADDSVSYILHRTRLEARADVLAGTLTIGELKRLEIARALAAEPSVLCLDEVMGGLNPSEIHDMMDFIRSLKADGTTILIIEHHVHAVVGLSDRILVLNFGEKIAEGPPTAVMKDPAVVTAYLGAEAPVAPGGVP
ncbi:MAG TPA: ABC transporter ATP-binding protein [Thermoanaerobaculia bacterium]|nr:ABC transporter ATP-binding protein [Thermoanaerobaculia bacterium]